MKPENTKSVFDTLSAIDVSNKTEKKNGKPYLSWAWAWSEVKRHYPEANYIVERFDNKPYIFDDNLGYMVKTRVMIEDETIEMHLPVMDNTNKAMRHVVYQKFGKDVQPATMFDINTAIMRCLVKNLAMFGLGLYIYAGEDLPEAPKVSTEDVKEFKTKLKNCANNDELGLLYSTLEEDQKANKTIVSMFARRKVELKIAQLK
jgi:hypothetical protein